MTSRKLRLGPTLKKLLKKHQMNLRSLSEATNIAQSTLYHWLENSNPRSVEDVKLVADYFGVSLHYLYFEADDPNSSAKTHLNLKISEDFTRTETLNIRITDKNDEIVLLQGYIYQQQQGKTL